MRRKRAVQQNKGFTLVEICVVMVLLSILATIATLGLYNWQEYSTYTQQEDNAELIYMAARNKIAKLRSNGVLAEFDGFGKNVRSLSGVTYKDPTTGEVVTDLNYAYCLRNDHARYDELKKNDPTGAKLIFDLISEYVNDSGILSGSIGIEYSASTGTVYAVFFSDKCDIKYSGSGPGVDLSSPANRGTEALKDKVIGKYSY